MILLSIVFVSFALSIIGAIEICRALVISSSAESYGRVWLKSILGEYDIHLIEDYGLLAYQGLDSDVIKKISNYSNYSISNRLNVKSIGIDANLIGYELSNPDNFRKTVKNSEISNTIDTLINNNTRKPVETAQEDRWGKRVIRNKSVIATLPSKCIKNRFDVDSIKNTIKSIKSTEDIISLASDASTEIAFMYKYLGSHTHMANSKKTLLRNEWEYVIAGNLDDNENFKSARRRIVLIRNAMNLAYLYSDVEKRELIHAVAELITPGPAASATAILISETWALVEAEEDIKDLLDNKRVPMIKDDSNWKTDLGGILKNEEITKELSDEGKELLKKNYDEITRNEIGHGVNKSSDKGLSYEDYLMVMIATMQSNIRILRIMDVVGINMKYRYYEDFNMDEYHIGLNYSIKLGRKQHEFEETYK